MNCDQAFDLMTDPALDDSTALHEHLDACPRCLQMYETLSPALGLFEKSPAAAAVEYEGGPADTVSAVDVAERVAVSLTQLSAGGRPRRGRAWAIYAAAALASFTTVLGLLLMFSEPSGAAPLQAAECTWLDRGASDEDLRSEAVVLSCVACHLPNSVE
jgi:hypothetical protein